MTITIFRNIFDIDAPFYTSVDTIVKRIKTGHCKTLVEEIRNHENKSDKNNLKKKLPAIVFSGTFKSRAKDALPLQHSGLIVLDIDEVEDLKKLKIKIQKSVYCFLCFVSPSGNGLKVVFKIPADVKRHTGYYLGIEKYFFDLGINLDKSGKNIGRVCYESFDPDIYYNPESKVFTDFIEEIQQAKKISKSVNIPASEDVVIDNLAKWCKKNFDFYSGRNQYIYQLAAALNRYGVSFHSALNHCLHYTDNSKDGDPFDDKEITGVVNKVYTNLKAEHGREVFQDAKKTKSVIDVVMSSAASQVAENLQQFEEFEDFQPVELEEIAEEVRNEKKPKPETKRVFWYYDDGKLKIDTKSLLSFINECGYYVYYPNDKPNNYFFIQVVENVISPVDTKMIKDTVLDFINKNNSNIVFNLMNERQKYWSEKFLDALPVIKPKILRDDYHTSFVPTPSGVFKITKDGVEKIEYLDLTEGFVWRSQITKKDFNYCEYPKDFDFLKFMQLITGDKIDILKSYLGYLMHNYKDPANAKAPFIYDTNLSQFDGQPEGGTGKSLIIDAIKHIREMVPVPADRLDFKRAFVLQEINESTQIVWFDEYDKNFDVKNFFSRITNGMPIEKKGKDVVNIEAENTPKFVFTGNYKPRGSSDSHKRRRLDFGIKKYFSAEHTPLDEFKRRFFVDWSEKEWDYYFSMYLDFISFYLKNGALKYDDSDEKYLTLISETSQDFAEYWIEDGNLEAVINTGDFTGRDHYFKIIEEKEVDSTKFTIKKYYIYLKRMFGILKIYYKFVGKGEKKVVEFVKQ